jgi:hypothetical protein
VNSDYLFVNAQKVQPNNFPKSHEKRAFPSTDRYRASPLKIPHRCGAGLSQGVTG